MKSQKHRTGKGGADQTQKSEPACHHLAFQDVGADWEIWLPVQGEPLPKRLKVVQKRRTGKPMVDVTFTTWDLASALSDATFVPEVPADYEGIAILQRAAAVKHTATADASPQSSSVQSISTEGSPDHEAAEPDPKTHLLAVWWQRSSPSIGVTPTVRASAHRPARRSRQGRRRGRRRRTAGRCRQR